MTLRDKIRKALAHGPKFYAQLRKLAKNDKQLQQCLYQMRAVSNEITLATVDAQNQYALKARPDGAAPPPRRTARRRKNGRAPAFRFTPAVHTSAPNRSAALSMHDDGTVSLQFTDWDHMRSFLARATARADA